MVIVFIVISKNYNNNSQIVICYVNSKLLTVILMLACNKKIKCYKVFFPFNSIPTWASSICRSGNLIFFHTHV